MSLHKLDAANRRRRRRWRRQQQEQFITYNWGNLQDGGLWKVYEKKEETNKVSAAAKNNNNIMAHRKPDVQ